jgi:SCP-2 sterol transfer family
MLQGPVPTKPKPVNYAKLKRLIRPGERDFRRAFARLAQRLKASGERAEVQVDLLQARQREPWSLLLEGNAATASRKAARRPDLHIILREQTWRQIATGERSPLESFLAGQVRLRGDPELAKRLFKRVAGPGETDPCR